MRMGERSREREEEKKKTRPSRYSLIANPINEGSIVRCNHSSHLILGLDEF